MWGVKSGQGIYRYTNDDQNPWVKIPGGLSDIGAAADGTVWGVNSGVRSTATPETSRADPTR
ncbi:tectonin domain-containing protein [Streptomyces sp. KS 21]|uniref:tectonin domain-containing protein n=1 Tax=Streptomyces sp. KS 21 TaxID=2485150 RepID=UPI001FBA49B5|nr:tectonin domain-containing protein [Streptomyces sp. KS 21]